MSPVTAEQPHLLIPARSPRARLEAEDVPGIVILDGGIGSEAEMRPPRVEAFVYGETVPSAPILPFGRWKLEG
jgi:hypothetical protein